MLLRTSVGYKDWKLMIPVLLRSALSHEACRVVEGAAVWYGTCSLAVSRPQSASVLPPSAGSVYVLPWGISRAGMSL